MKEAVSDQEIASFLSLQVKLTFLKKWILFIGILPNQILFTKMK
jgi:hypothetical protein